MTIYAYQANVWCHECARAIMERLLAETDAVGRARFNSGDTDDWPQPIANDEACDTPQHCAGCGLFFGNPLTDDGERYVGEELADALVRKGWGGHNAPCIAEWWDVYHELPLVRIALLDQLWAVATSRTGAPRDAREAGIWLRRFAMAGIDWEEVSW